MKKTCVIGWPIKHSRSPLIHNYWIKAYGIDANYEKVAVAPEMLPDFIRDLPHSGYVGCNVTIPHKERVFELVDETDMLAKRLGAVNTVYFRKGQTLGTNTDGEGFLSSLKAAYPDLELQGRSAVVIGAGGAAKAVIGALLDQGMERIGIINRTALRADQLTQLFSGRVYAVSEHDRDKALAACSLLVQTTSMGMEGQPALDFDFARLPTDALVADLVYTPMKTDFLKSAEKRGNRILPGLGMLLHQAVRGFQLWHGVMPEVTDELYDLVARDISP
jgi:shikimate dehydrogenase